MKVSPFNTAPSAAPDRRGVIERPLKKRLCGRLCYFFPLGFALITTGAFAIDRDGDGMCDVWEARYHAEALAPDSDFDHDSFTNLTESLAGTDPLEGRSFPQVVLGVNIGETVEIVLPTKEGNTYQLQSSGRLDGGWKRVGEIHPGNGNDLLLTAPKSENRQFYRVAISDSNGAAPQDAMPYPQISIGKFTRGISEIIVPTQAGKNYQLEGSDTLNGDWEQVGGPLPGDGAELHMMEPLSGGRRFYRVAVSDRDSDGDGVSDWAENQLSGFDPHNGDSFSSGIANHDLVVATQMFQALLDGEVSATVTAQDAYEKDGNPAIINLTRSGATTYPLTVFMKQRGAEEPEKSSASATDFSLVTSGAAAGTMVIPAGAASTQLLVQPVADNLNEVPEELRFDISRVADGLLTRICDAKNLPANERLFYAAYLPESASTASGYSLIRLHGDNSTALVSSVFFGLTTPQSGAHIHVKNPVTGPQLKTLPPGQLEDQEWQIRAAQFLTTDQAVLDALFAGKLYTSVSSEQYPAGEIRADYVLTTGSTDFVPPAAPPAVTPLAGDELDRDIARFLTQATFGPTPELMKQLRTLVNSPPFYGNRVFAFYVWLDDKLDATLTPPASLETFCLAEDALLTEIYTGNPQASYYDATFLPKQYSRRSAWWTTALFSDDQVRQRMATALSEILVTSAQDAVVNERHYGQTQYYDLLANSMSGRYRRLLEKVSTHPIMGYYLSSLRNQKELTDSSGNTLVSPDENFAREIMQLFSIGLVQLHPDGSLKLSSSGQPIPTYNQEDIIDLARLFTGWSFSKRNEPFLSSTIIDNTDFDYGTGNRCCQAQWQNPMKQFPEFHDTDAKSVLGLDIPAGQSGEAELTAFLDHLAAHPNIAPFISKRLIQRLVTSNPSSGYIYRVSNAWQAGGGNLERVLKAILLDPEARSLEVADRVGAGKKKEPVIHYTGVARALQANTEVKVSDLAPHTSSSFLDAFPATAGYFRAGDTAGTIGQSPLEAPSVFNWFHPDYSPGGKIADAGLVTPEFEIATELKTITHINSLWTLTVNNTGVVGGSFPNFAESGYGIDAGNLIPDVSQGAGATQARESVYMAVMDENGDGIVSAAGDPGTFGKPAKIRKACAALVDHLDLLLCSGTLKADYGNATSLENPRDIIIDFVAANGTFLDYDDNAQSQERARHERYEKAAYIISVCPQSMIQR
jgi:uncharacterized protein (DUF1800 family)